MNNIGVYGLGTMGLNIARNLANHDYKVSGYNRELEVIQSLRYQNIEGFEDEVSFVNSLQSPRIVLLMVTAGRAVDQVIAQITPLLNRGDVIIDGGNSYYKDSTKRHKKLTSEGLRYVSMGVSGGEVGALEGPSLMPSCDPKTYEIVRPYLESIAARDADGNICCKRLGSGGAGHFIKTVHNGIEYAEMQVIADVHELLVHASNMNTNGIIKTFEQWNQGLHKSYLMGITLDILKKKDVMGRNLLERVEDIAVQNGTGKWTIASALEVGVSSSILYSALGARIVSENKKERMHLAKTYTQQSCFLSIDEALQEMIKEALLCSRIVIYEQGLEIINSVSKLEGWDLDLKEVLSVWRAGCIIASSLVDDLSRNFQSEVESMVLSTNPYMRIINRSLTSWRKVSALIVEKGIYAPTLVDSLSYFEGKISARTSANLIQAMRNYFGAHPYHLIDQEGEQNTDWSS